MVAGHRQHIADAAALKGGPQPWVGTVDLVPGDPGGRHPSVQRAVSIWVASAGLVAKLTCSGMPAVRQRSGSAIQLLSRYSSRSIMACPASLAYTR
jgi:hypothetical protein